MGHKGHARARESTSAKINGHIKQTKYLDFSKEEDCKGLGGTDWHREAFWLSVLKQKSLWIFVCFFVCLFSPQRIVSETRNYQVCTSEMRMGSLQGAGKGSVKINLWKKSMGKDLGTLPDLGYMQRTEHAREKTPAPLPYMNARTKLSMCKC